MTTPAPDPAEATRAALVEALAEEFWSGPPQPAVTPWAFVVEHAAVKPDSELAAVAARYRRRAEKAIERHFGPALAIAASLAARLTAAEREHDEAHPTNDTLRKLGAFDRKTKIGKHQATHWGYLRTVIEALDAAGQSDAADVLVWQVWHRVNSAARHDEFYRLALADRDAAHAEAVRLRARVAELEGALNSVEGLGKVWKDTEQPEARMPFELAKAVRIARTALTDPKGARHVD